MDYGRGVLFEHSWMTDDPNTVQPGRFVIGTGAWFEYRVVPDGEWPYMGIALDGPRPPTQLAIMSPTDLGPLEEHTGTVGRMGIVCRTDQRRSRIGEDRADRAYDLVVALDRLIDRFHADPKHQQTGWTAACVDDLGVITTIGDLEKPEYVRCVEIPMGARKVLGIDDSVYSSHFRLAPGVLSPALDTWPLGYAGALTLVGQMTCIAAVLSDRLAELITIVKTSSDIESVMRLAGRRKHPIKWAAEERRDLEQARGELWAWSPAPALRGALAALPRDPANGSEKQGLTKVEPNVETAPVDLVSLNQMAAVVHKRKKTLQNRKASLPAPETPGGGGTEALWSWRKVRQPLSDMFNVKLPVLFPAHPSR